MNAYEKARQVGIVNLPPEQVVAILQTLSITNIDCQDVVGWLRETKLLIWTGERYLGPIQDAIVGLSDDHPVTMAVNDLKSGVFQNSATVLRTSEVAYAPQIYGLIQLIAGRSPDAAALIDSFYAMGGGRQFKDLTLEAYSALVSQHALVDAERDRKAALEAIPDNDYQAFVVRYNAAKLGIADGSLTTIEQVNAAMRAV